MNLSACMTSSARVVSPSRKELSARSIASAMRVPCTRVRCRMFSSSMAKCAFMLCDGGEGLTESAGNVVFGLLMSGISENPSRFSDFHDLPFIEKGGVV